MTETQLGDAQAPAVKSAYRVFEILELFEREQRSMKVTEIVRHLDLPQSSVSMLLKTLVERGYMDFDPQGRGYCPSMRVAFMGDWIARIPNQQNRPLPDTLQDLATQTGEKVLLARQSGMFAQYVSTVEPKDGRRAQAMPGMQRPLHRCAVGIMLLSQLKDDQIGCLLRRYNALHAKKEEPSADIDRIQHRIESARQQGYYESADLATPGSGVVATLLPARTHGQRLALGIAAPTARLHQNRSALVPAVMAAARLC